MRRDAQSLSLCGACLTPPSPPPFPPLSSFTDLKDPCRNGSCYISISLYMATYCLGAQGNCQSWMYLTDAYLAPQVDFDVSTSILKTLAGVNTGIIFSLAAAALLSLLATGGTYCSCTALDSLTEAHRTQQQQQVGRVGCLATSKATSALTATALVLCLVAGIMGWSVFGAGAALLQVASASTYETSQSIEVTTPGSYTAAGAFVSAIVAMSLTVSQKLALRNEQRRARGGALQTTLEGFSGSRTEDCCCC